MSIEISVLQDFDSEVSDLALKFVLGNIFW